MVKAKAVTKKAKKKEKTNPKTAIANKKIEKSLEIVEKEMDEITKTINGKQNNESDKETTIKASKPITQLKRGDKINVDSLNLEIDSHYILIDHGSTKEMAIELFDPKTDKDYQLRYFLDQVENSLEFYELQEIIYVKRKVDKIEW
ncbi:MAG: hypothetical protein Q7S74_00360 [Nanoarchaeota archaeon]|nr:hypothetical protein [Nanoarchaeota archaeon]